MAGFVCVEAALRSFPELGPRRRLRPGLRHGAGDADLTLDAPSRRFRDEHIETPRAKYFEGVVQREQLQVRRSVAAMTLVRTRPSCDATEATSTIAPENRQPRNHIAAGS